MISSLSTPILCSLLLCPLSTSPVHTILLLIPRRSSKDSLRLHHVISLLLLFFFCLSSLLLDKIHNSGVSQITNELPSRGLCFYTCPAARNTPPRTLLTLERRHRQRNCVPIAANLLTLSRPVIWLLLDHMYTWPIEAHLKQPLRQPLDPSPTWNRAVKG